MGIDEPSRGLKLAIQAAGSRFRLGADLGISWPAIRKWTDIPSAERAMQIEQLYKIPRSDLRPDIYPPDRERALLPVDSAKAEPSQE